MAGARSSAKRHGPEIWPALPLDEWKETYATLHRWTQIVGKVRFGLFEWRSSAIQIAVVWGLAVEKKKTPAFPPTLPFGLRMDCPST
jgi:hypothetical protein